MHACRSHTSALAAIVCAASFCRGVVVSAVVADGEEAEEDVIHQQALVRKAFEWQRWPLKGATFIPQADAGAEEGAEVPPMPVA